MLFNVYLVENNNRKLVHTFEDSLEAVPAHVIAYAVEVLGLTDTGLFEESEKGGEFQFLTSYDGEEVTLSAEAN